MEQKYKKCRGCGGNLYFSPEYNNLKCSSCDSVTSFDKFNSIEKKPYTKQNEKLTKNQIIKNCYFCGAQITLNGNEITHTCPYCDNSFVLEKSEMQGLTPNLIIPFNFSKEKAVEYYKEGVKKARFLPNKFKKAPSFESLTGTYVPCFAFDCSSETNYNGKLYNETTWTDSNGHSHTSRSYFNIGGLHGDTFENYLIEASNKTTQSLFKQIEPYKINKESVYEYNANFIRGYKVNSNDSSLNSCKLLSEDLMNDEIKRRILSKYSYDGISYYSQTTHFSNEKFAYILLPLYFFTIKHKKKEYLTYLNGQTGKLGKNLPKSALKITLFVLLIILGLGLVIGLPFILNILGLL